METRPVVPRMKFPSPCPAVLSYEGRDASSGRWFTTLTTATFEDLNGIWIRIELDRAVEELTTKFGETTSLNTGDFLITNEDFKLLNGRELTIKISAKYDVFDIIPSVVRIRLNGRLICGQPAATTPATTTKFSYESQSSTFTEKKPRPSLRCGKFSNIGTWPWSVAILRHREDESLKYNCGGVLISDQHVLTTSHRVMKTGTEKLEAEDLLLHLGTDRLRKHGPGFQIAQVFEIRAHPNYKPISYSDDLAVLKLARPVERSDYVMPICLSEKEDLQDIIGKSATLVTWGLNEDNKTVSQRELRMVVVSQETCINSDRTFYPRYTSSKTFCAAYTNGTFACLGSSGSGIVLPTGRDRTWQLHSIVAIAKLREDHTGCEPNGYLIFMNVNQYSDWMKDVINIYIINIFK